jgi:hypothetical protein
MPVRTVVTGRKSFSISGLYQYYKQGKLIFNTEYQRSYVWPKRKRRLLLDSILKGYDINKIFLRQLEDGKFECLDGQQRLRSIFEFLEDGFTLSEETGLGPKKFSELDEEDRTAILSYIVDSDIIYQADEGKVTEIFLRLQEGMPLNSAEKLNALGGALRDRVIGLSHHRFMRSIGIPDTRFAHRYFIAQVLWLELQNTDLPQEGMNIVDVGYKRLEKMYRDYSGTLPPAQVIRQVKRTMNFLYKVLGRTGCSCIQHKGDLVPIYLVASYILRKYSVEGREGRIREFMEAFLTAVANGDPAYSEYRLARSHAIDSKPSIETGFNVMLQRLLEYIPDLPLKDPSRSFDYGQKLAIYFRDRKRCRGCDRELRFEEAEFHHLVPWSEGGPTTVENGVLLCPDCHSRRHGRRGGTSPSEVQ